MSRCPCSAELSPPTEAHNKLMATVGHCHQCLQTVFFCANCEKWNRAFATFCTHCGKRLQKPVVWGMAAVNKHRTAVSPQMGVADCLDSRYGFVSWTAPLPKIVRAGSLPALLALDGLILVPNTADNRMDAYSIALVDDQIQLRWSVEFDSALSYASTPIYYGLHLFYVVSGGLRKMSVWGDGPQPVDLHEFDASRVVPVPECAPLLFDDHAPGKVNPKMLIVLRGGLLVYDLKTSVGNYIPHELAADGDCPGSPVICGERIILTSKNGKIFSFNFRMKPYNTFQITYKDLSFSAPVAIADKVYFEAVSQDGERSIRCYDPHTKKIIKAAALDDQNGVDAVEHQSRLVYPPLTDEEKLFLSDRLGRTVYIYDDGFLQKYRLSPDDNRLRFVPHRSVVVNHQIYSATPTGLTYFDTQRTHQGEYRSLAIRRPDNPVPIASPIRYGDKLFILCEDRLVCVNH